MTKETVSQIKERIAERFDILDILTQECLNGNSRALIVSGPAGLGKSFTVEKRLKDHSNELCYSIVKGYVRPTGLFTILYKHRNKGDDRQWTRQTFKSLQDWWWAPPCAWAPAVSLLHVAENTGQPCGNMPPKWKR